MDLVSGSYMQINVRNCIYSPHSCYGNEIGAVSADSNEDKSTWPR